MIMRKKEAAVSTPATEVNQGQGSGSGNGAGKAVSGPGTGGCPGKSASLRDVFIAGVIVLLSFLIYNANLRIIGAIDTYPARYLPFSIVRYHTLFMEDVADVALQGNSPEYYIARNQKGRIISFYPVVAPILVSPLYIPAVAWLNKKGWTEQRLDFVARIMEKVSASLLASLSAGLMYLLLRRRLGIANALLLTIAYAFGTNTWMIGSQALWQHGTAELLMICCLLVITGRCTVFRGYALGIFCGLLAFNRPPDAAFSAAFMCYGIWWSGRKSWWMFAGAVTACVPLVIYNFMAAGNIAGGYGLIPDKTFFKFSIPPGIAGLLFSPVRGLFVFTPFLLFLVFGIRSIWAEFRRSLLGILLSGAILLQIVMYAKTDWRAGWCWGPRYLTDMLPLLVWMLVPVVSNFGRFSYVSFVALAGASIAIQIIGAFWYNFSSDLKIMAVKCGPDRLKGVWDVRYTPFLLELRHPMADRNLLLGNMRGNIDRISIDDQEVTEIPQGPEITVEGWALSDDGTPAVVNVLLLPMDCMKWTALHHAFEYPKGRTSAFFIRPDVCAAIPTSLPTGWRVSVWTGRLAPGDYQLQLSAQSHKGGEFRPVVQHPFRILPARDKSIEVEQALRNSAAFAAARIRADQQPRGFWFTSYTKSTNFERPKPEMNTFLTSMLVDVLDPIAAECGLNETLDRARHHLADQIEGDGLVRYHGRPDELEPSLGIKITPDADDTALVWRIAGRDKEKIPGVLSILRTYRTPQGLFRTWLSPRERYVGIDPGKDPNPPDIAIQMHVLMFLAKTNPEVAHRFYGLLQLVGDDRLWVYYQMTPLIPLLRERDLGDMHYPLTIPESHLHTSIPEQEPWVGLCQLLANHLSHESHPLDPSWPATLLESLAKDDFAAVRQEPPLLYHNDMTASVSRFYWSEDFGYALWLRLYYETIHKGVSTAR